MDGMGLHSHPNGRRGDDGAMATLEPLAISTALSPQRLVPFPSPWAPPPQQGPAAAAGEPERDSAWHRQHRIILAALPVAAVAVVAGVVSYSHIVALSLRAGQSVMDAHLSPIPVDGLIVGGSVILWFGSWLGWFAVAPGVAATLFANVESGLPRGPLAAAVAAWPAVAFTVATIVLERWLKSQAEHPVSSLAGDSGSDEELRDDRRDDDDRGDEDSDSDEQPKPRRQRQESPDAGDKVRAVLKASRRLKADLLGGDAAKRKAAKTAVAEKAGVSERSVERVMRDLAGAPAGTALREGSRP